MADENRVESDGDESNGSNAYTINDVMSLLTLMDRDENGNKEGYKTTMHKFHHAMTAWRY